jgi:SAM-dependent methyltransferase
MEEAEHAQSEAARESGTPPEDHWAAVADRFREDPRRPMEPSLWRLVDRIDPTHTLLDVGAGAGRLALPLALHCKQVVAVEPSQSMLTALKEDAARNDIHNVTTVQAEWESAQVEPGDVTLCVNVLYTVRDVEGFIRKLEAHSRERVIIVLHMQHPQTQTYPFWKLVHGEERRPPPGLRELIQVLWEMDIYPDLEMLPARPPRGYDSREAARKQLLYRLFLEPGGAGEGRLEEAMDELLVESAEGLGIPGVGPTRPGLVTWRPQGGQGSAE